MKIKRKTFNLSLYIVGAALLIIILLVVFNKPPTYDPVDTPKPYLGNPDAAVQIIDYSDLQCPACKRAHPAMKQIIADFGDQIGYQFYHMPLRSIHEYAQKAAEAAECANDQGRFYDFIDAVYASPNEPTEKVLKNIAEALQLDMDSFTACLDSDAKEWVVDADYNEAVAKGIQSTPTILVNGEKVPNWQDYEAFTAQVQAALDEAGVDDEAE